jgi:regulator of protease activity HflC (stomatin/prohibitin superfamily)
MQITHPSGSTKLPLSVKLVIWAVAIVVFCILFFGFMFRTVGERQVGIITRFGEVNRIANPGPVIKFPWDKLTKMDTSVLKEEQTASAATSDLQDVSTVLALNYAVDDDTAVRIYKEIGPEYVSRIIQPALQESVKSSTAKYTAQEMITKRPEVKAAAEKVINTRLKKYGIRVVDLSIVDARFSAEFNAAIESVQVANQNVAKARQELETTKVEAEKRVAEATAAAEAQRLQQQTLTPQLLQKQAIEAWDGKLPTYYGGSNGTFFNIPLQGQ